MLSERSCIYGAMTEVEPFLAEAFDVTVRPVLCYIAPHMDEPPATTEYVGELAESVRAAGLLEGYAEFLESFRPEKSR